MITGLKANLQREAREFSASASWRLHRPGLYPDVSYNLVLMLPRNPDFTKLKIHKKNRQSAEEEFIPSRQLAETLMYEI